MINQAGLIKQFSKQEKLANVFSLIVFSEEMLDKNVGLLLARGVRSLVGIEMDKKEVGEQISF